MYSAINIYFNPSIINNYFEAYMNKKIADLIPIKGNTLNRDLSRLFESMIIFLILADVILLTLISFLKVSPQVYGIIVFFDLTVVLILIPEFIYRLWKADRRKKFLKHNGSKLLEWSLKF